MFQGRMNRTFAFLGASALVIMAAGCNSDAAPAKFPSARLEGLVTVDGKPIQDGMIQFAPASKAAGGVTQATIVEGRYVASQVPLGDVTAFLFATPAPPPAPETLTTAYKPEPVLAIPERYKKGFKINVKETNPDVNFDMTSK